MHLLDYGYNARAYLTGNPKICCLSGPVFTHSEYRVKNPDFEGGGTACLPKTFRVHIREIAIRAWALVRSIQPAISMPSAPGILMIVADELAA